MNTDLKFVAIVEECADGHLLLYFIFITFTKIVKVNIKLYLYWFSCQILILY